MVGSVKLDDNSRYALEDSENTCEDSIKLEVAEKRIYSHKVFKVCESYK